MTECVTFVYLGSPIPSYAVKSLALAVRHSGLPVHLIASASARPQLPRGVGFTSLEDFYDPELFADAAKNILLPHTVREGFWLKTLERFFVLGQFQRHVGLSALLHAELDQLLFRVDRLVEHIGSLDKTGVFVPRHSDILAVGSIVFCNSVEKLESMLDFARLSEPFDNEMSLIARWVRENPANGHFLPTVSNLIGPCSDLAFVQAYGGISDAAQLGQWVAGIDPRNVPLSTRPANKYVDPPAPWLATREQLAILRFELRPDGSLVAKTSEDSEHVLYNLHLHSKIHAYVARNTNGVTRLLSIANQEAPVVFPGVRRTQFLYHTTKAARRLRIATFRSVDRLRRALGVFMESPSSLAWSTIRRLNVAFGRRPSSFPFISGDSFRASADHVWETKFRFSGIDVQEGEVVFCESEKADEQFIDVMRDVSKPFVLLLGNSDLNQGRNLTHLMSQLNPKVAVFAQNLMEDVNRAEVLPIGLENAWRANFGRVSGFKAQRRRDSQKTFRVMWGFSERTNPPVRSTVAGHLTQIAVADRQPYLSAADHRKALATYAFVASPPGNGLDTHRTWEAMYLRCVPIVLRSEMTERYAKLGLPVWVVDSYAELSAQNEQTLKVLYQQFLPSFEAEPLWMPYWLERIAAAQSSLRRN